MWHGMWPDEAVYWPWILWAITWVAASLWANRTVKRPGIGREWIYRLITLAGFVLLLGGFVKTQGDRVVWARWPGVWGDAAYPPAAIGWTMVALTVLGFLFAWWARLHLGRLWSGSITRKEGHHVVDTGPYAIVRHPIYTGILLSGIASAIAIAQVHAYLGALLLIIGYWLKARLEERWLREELGPQDYDAYRRRVPMLVPFGPKAA
jgi:protein-S-isoprenylcysteine O-methyltransferase Ste14